MSDAATTASATPSSPPSSDRVPRSIHPPRDPSAPPPAAGLRGWWLRLSREPNAIWMREMRQSARLARTPWILLTLVLVLTLVLSSIGGLTASSGTSPAELGGALFQIFFGIAYFVVVLVGPTVAANGIAAEREGRTWEAVLLTGMTPKEIARGKFLAAYTTMALYIVALAPVGALSFLFGGVTAGEVVIAFVFLFLLAALAVAFGLAVSSFMSNLRGAIVITLMLAAVTGPMLFSMGGFGCSFLAHKLWPDVPEGMPIWLPLAYQRAAFGLDYLVVLVVFPLLLVSVPAWFLYEATIANLTGEADDRSSGLKRWFAITTPIVALTGSVPSLLATDYGTRAGLCITGILVFVMHMLLCAMLFAAEPPGPSRRIEVRWRRANVSAVTRFLGPGLFRTMLLVLFMCIAGVAAIALIDGAALVAGSVGTSTVKERSLDQIAVVAAYVTPYCVFCIGLLSWLRSRNASPWIPRIIAVGVLFLIAVAPWVVAAITGVLADSSAKAWILLAAPSPFFLASMLSEIGSYAHDAPMTVPVGMIFALAWGALGLMFLSIAKHRSGKILAERDAILKRSEAAYEAEERAAAATNQAAMANE
jgi:hypothetical protein